MKLKKFLFATSMILATSISGYSDVVLAEYFGEKANDSTKNPCKGETIRVCGRVRKEANFQIANMEVLETVEDANGNVINRQTLTFNSIEKMMRYLYMVPDNAVIVENSDDNNE